MPPEKGREQSTDSDGMEESQLAQVGGWDVGVFLLFTSISHVSFFPKCYMALHDEEDDPAVYRSGSSKNKGKETQNNTTASPSTSKPKKLLDSVDDEQDNEEEPTGSPFDPCEDESTLLSTHWQPGFDKLLLVLRDNE